MAYSHNVPGSVIKPIFSQQLVDSATTICYIILPENCGSTNLDEDGDLFELLACLEVANSIAQGRFKFYAPLVAVDFLVSHIQLFTSVDTEYPTIMKY